MSKELKIRGFASLFNSFDSDADMVMPGAFVKSLLEFQPAMLWNHDINVPVGRWDVVEERKDVAGEAPQGLWVEGVIMHPETIFKVRNRMVRGLSIGYRAEHVRNLKNGGRELHQIELCEISIVAVPMHRGCLLTFDGA